jgi:hypothetical protein
MNYNRRNFLKLAGLTGASLFGSCNLKGTGSLNKDSNSTLEHIKEESIKSYSQIFNMSGYAAPKLNKVRVGFIGLGGRGSAAVTRLSYIEGVEIKGLCDLLPERAEAATERIKTPGHSPNIYSGKEDVWMEMCNRDDLDLIYIATPWPLHAPMGIFAMEHEKHVATEIPAATTVKDAWKLVQTSERTKSIVLCLRTVVMITLNY